MERVGKREKRDERGDGGKFMFDEISRYNQQKEEVRKVRPVTLASSYTPKPLTHHVTHEIPSQRANKKMAAKDKKIRCAAAKEWVLSEPNERKKNSLR